MRLSSCIGAVLLLTIVSALPAFAASRGSTRSKKAQPIAFEKDVKPLLDQYCFSCHGNGKKKGGLALDAFKDEAAIIAERETWGHVLQNVANRIMPPEGKPQPTDAERARIANWIESVVFYVDCENPDPGRVTIRRLNRVEYNNTIRDLLGIEFEPANDFPQDDVGYGFDNIGDVLSMPPILLEKYMTAADKALSRAIVTEDPSKPHKRTIPAHTLLATTSAGPTTGSWLSINREGEAYLSYKFPADGEYMMRVRAYGQQAGNEPPRMAFRVAGNELKKFDVPQEEGSPSVFEARFQAKAGTNRVAVAYLNNFVNPQDPNPRRRDRNLLIEYIEFEGPFGAGPQPFPESHRRIFTRQPTPTDRREVARDLISSFAKRAFRRPVQAAEIERVMQLFDLAEREGETFEKSVKVALQGVLVSPHFLFRGEIQPEPDNPKSVHNVNEFALASRLSYFLWSTMPDDELFAQAARGTLRKNLDSQVRRMLRHPRSRALVDNFAGQWLQIRNLDIVSPDADAFPDYDRELRLAMEKETELFFEYVVREDRSILEFLSSDVTFVNERLAKHYGIAGVSGPEFQRVSLKGTPRGGLLTQASILTITSNPTRTSPVKRGKWVLDNILGTIVPPPPPDVPELKEGKELTGTLRQRMEQHRDNPMCASCHALMDPIGFGFENFDAIGAWRGNDGASPVDPAGKLVTGEEFKGPLELKAILVEHKRDEFVRCLTEKMLTYALGRGLEYYDKCAVDEITRGVAKRHYKFSALVSEIVKSVPFQKRRGEGDRLSSRPASTAVAAATSIGR